MDVLRIAAFSQGNQGGNPAGVLISEKLPSAEEMQKIAKDVGFSETAFAMPEAGNWRVRYFAPETEIPFCGHATIALGAALAMREGDGRFSLKLNHAEISVEGRKEGELFAASLQSPGTRNRAATEVEIEQALALFNYEKDDLAPGIPPALIHAGADHIVLPLRSREKLASMHYDLSRGRVLMNRQGWTTILLINSETPTRFHSRNPFASGGVYEDPATGASTAAFAAYLRDLGWPHGGSIEVIQGEDMGSPSHLRADIGNERGGSIRLSGTARLME
ncbi:MULTISPECIES: PhzF family phenazine biosynthesis protein [Brucella]|uniref:Phenazine biosynthesis, PhzF family protein n=1 Tax=Brucella pseudogrignonensis TaxID=419475 RepID=A0A1A9FIM8_9HYPH|nr:MULTISPECIES: PhzF family phenazine biosynthesis protein [Brucella]EMG55390.1 phenazine biosynthesis protein PhzF family protein [Ochrobactrum sp. CDB2]MBK0020103.1 PhzF family phenazine biosynthesis protein [Ochrobactrum sp. S45]MBK0043157.1 PhzF family phenazine biosynthesis protein [Ochrobactrum sp. S46]MQP39753.1 PhzF family phenazine biosynthesis isomerase [Ochrobactrum sp. MYb237]ANG95065.1 PhzF family phenazine biosynthesis protein [Brucella pseudogrignonensis]